MNFHPYANVFPLLAADELATLAADIRSQGLQQPIVLLNGQILDGRNRYLACEQAGVAPRFTDYTGDDPVGFVVSANLKRRHLNESQRAMVGATIKPLFEEQARARQSAAGGDRKSVSANLREAIGDTGKAADHAAAVVSVSPRLVEHASQVIAQGAEELANAVRAGNLSASTAATLTALPVAAQVQLINANDKAAILNRAKEIRSERALVNAAQRKELRDAALAIVPPTGKYRCIVIDPPWAMEKIERDERPNQVGFDYPTMSEDELKAFGVPDMAADQCHLFLWTTQKFLPLALRLLDAWGFRYLFTMVWHKPGGFQPIGLPQYNCEFVLFARKGALGFNETRQFFTCFQAPRREHSRKPDEFYDLVRRVSPGPRIDVFSREARDGFAQYGNQTDHFVEMPA